MLNVYFRLLLRGWQLTFDRVLICVLRFVIMTSLFLQTSCDTGLVSRFCVNCKHVCNCFRLIVALLGCTGTVWPSLWLSLSCLLSLLKSFGACELACMSLARSSLASYVILLTSSTSDFDSSLAPLIGKLVPEVQGRFLCQANFRNTKKVKTLCISRLCI